MLYRRGKVWWMKIRWGGRLIRRSTKTRNKDLAKKVQEKVLLRLADRKWSVTDTAGTTLFREAWDKYMREEARYKATDTSQRAEQCAKRFLPHIGNLFLSQVTPAVLSSYKSERLESGVSMGTVVKELQFVRRVFSLCKREWQLVSQSPFEFFKMPAVNDARMRFLTDAEFDRILLSCPDWLRPMVLLARHTGLRRGNIVGLRWDHVDLEGRVINLDVTKNGQRLTVPQGVTVCEVLARQRTAKVAHLGCGYVFHQKGVPYSPSQVSVAFQRACRRAGVSNFRFHDLRHDYASRIVQNGYDLYIVQQLLGHKDGRMTQRYAHLKVENLRSAVESLEGGHKMGHSDEEEGVAVVATP